MSKRDGNQKGPQQHPEGAHGDRTHSRLVEQLNSGANANDQPEPINHAGKSHLYEDRQQHDEADKNSDKDRIRHDQAKGRTNDPRGKLGEAEK
jgi:hypothetical protein